MRNSHNIIWTSLSLIIAVFLYFLYIYCQFLYKIISSYMQFIAIYVYSLLLLLLPSLKWMSALPFICLWLIYSKKLQCHVLIVGNYVSISLHFICHKQAPHATSKSISIKNVISTKQTIEGCCIRSWLDILCHACVRKVLRFYFVSGKKLSAKI